ncbi:Endonuclease YncB, thermonuclease family [Rhizobium sp. RU20A]|uniref:thermonuclease family protein n=1 Tax=Rhizobium sp. RU20A TaxID=1907412 RepID=UPI00095700B3|nr:thermonuclease family protein [Rhizobium sp. RU20A]SIQ14423.1 Endonuclease YncB, thermonuclease family [Rhizobium sp. RU20A]
MARAGRLRGIRARDVALVIGLVLAFVAVAVKEQAPGTGGRLVGAARVVDGDTLAFGERRVRLLGIDAPERGQMCWRDTVPRDCGRAATAALTALIDGKTVTCDLEGEDRYRRALGRCFDAAGRDLNAVLVRSGMAVAFGAYVAEERAAAAERAGIWSGDFDRPRDFRLRQGGLDEGPHLPGGWLAPLWQWLSGEAG